MGAMPMQVYAAGVDQSTRRPKVGLLLAGVGLNQAESDAAVRTLPGGITLAFSPYAPNPTKLLAAARLAEHEYLVSLPMEPQGFPINDPGVQAMMADLSPEQNHQMAGMGDVPHRRLCRGNGRAGHHTRRAICLLCPTR